MELHLTGRNIVVTGAGLGPAVTQAFVAEGGRQRHQRRVRDRRGMITTGRGRSGSLRFAVALPEEVRPMTDVSRWVLPRSVTAGV